jgi:glycosyltransferase involved in cell wall biosynthesis
MWHGGLEAGDAAPEPPPLRTEAEVMARWQGDEPVVSILCPTYQHVGFIEDALRGFLGQDTDFPFEILVRDDASTDGTADIVRDYTDRYPNIIRAVLETENTWPEVKAGQVLRPMARGRFTTVCEGDDYWIDPGFLTDARAELEGHPSVSGVVGSTVICRDGTIVGHERPDPSEWQWYLPIRALMHRSGLAETRIPRVQGDRVLALAIQRSGRIRSLGRHVAVYRLHEGGAWTGLSKLESRSHLVRDLTTISCHMAEVGELDLARAYQRKARAKIEWMLEPFGITPPTEPSSASARLRSRVGRWLSRSGLRRPR